jgi:signal transduction histidine kinase
MGTNNSGKWSNKVLTVRVRILPYWYQTFGFKLLMLFFIAAILYGIYKYRVQQLIKMAEMRQKISGDLHDDIGATLSSNKIYTTLAQQAPDNKKYIKLIEENTNSVIKSLEEMVWSINPKNDTVSALAAHMENYAKPLFLATKINCQFISNLKDIHIPITPKQRRHLFLSFKEMVNNVIKHSRCNNCYINFSKKGNYLYIEVRDDGQGFEKEKINSTRNGLHNLAFRAKEVKGRFIIDTEQKKGTTVRTMVKI